MLEDVCSLPHTRPNAPTVHAIYRVGSVALAMGSFSELTTEQATDTLSQWFGAATSDRQSSIANCQLPIAERTLPYIMIANKL